MPKFDIPIEGGQRMQPSSLLANSIGRTIFFFLTLTLFGGTCAGFTLRNLPSLSSPNSLLLTMFTLAAAAIFFSLPVFAEHAGIGVFDANWKPFAHFFRLAFLCAIPAVIFITLGLGGSVAGGGDVLMSARTMKDMQAVADNDVPARVGDAFALDDGFIALNQTKALVETVFVSAMGTKKPQVREGVEFEKPTHFVPVDFFQAEDPLAPPPPPLPNDMIGMYVIAPIFESWQVCLTRAEMTNICMIDNNLLGFAYAEIETWCRWFKIMGCKAPKPLLQPVYDCQTETPIQGLDYPLKVQGLCGRIRQPPEILLEEEIVRMHTESGWQLGTTMARPDGPKAGDLVQACTASSIRDDDPDERIANPTKTQATWQAQQGVGLTFGMISVGLVIFTALMDCYTDRYLRAANKYTM